MSLTQQEKKQLQELMKSIQKHEEHILSIDYTYHKNDFFTAIESLWGYLKSYPHINIFNLYRHTKQYKKSKENIKRVQAYYERALEMTEASCIISNIYNKKLTEYFNNPFTADNYRMVKNEVALFENKNPDVLVMVGCGALPETILYLVENTNIKKIIGIDCSQEAISMAGDIVNAQELEGKVKLYYTYGEEYDFFEADIIHMANSVHGKEKILKQIEKTGKEGVEVFVRIPYETSNIFNENIDTIPSQLILKKKDIVISEYLDSQIILEKMKY